MEIRTLAEGLGFPEGAGKNLDEQHRAVGECYRTLRKPQTFGQRTDFHF